MPIEGQTGTAPDGTRVVWRGGKAVSLNSPKARPDWGVGAVELPDGQIVRYGPKGGATVLSKGNRGGADGDTPDLREFEINAAARATLMDAGQRSYEKARTEGYSPSAPMNVFAKFVEDAPIPGGNFMADVIRDNPSERARAAELQFVDGALRTTSGANAPEAEVRRATKQYFRQPGEGATVEPEREALRRRFRDTSVRAAGQAYIPALEGAGTIREPFDLSAGQSRASVPKGAFYKDPKATSAATRTATRATPSSGMRAARLRSSMRRARPPARVLARSKTATASGAGTPVIRRRGRRSDAALGEVRRIDRRRRPMGSLWRHKG